MYLILKEIIPFETANNEVTYVHERVHIAISKSGIFEFPPRKHTANWSSLPFKSSNEKQNAIQFYGLSSYFPFTHISWSSQKIVLDWNRFVIKEDDEESNEDLPASIHHSSMNQISPLFNNLSDESSYLAIETVSMSHTLTINDYAETGISFISLGKRFFEKCRYIDQVSKASKIKRVVGSTFEIILSSTPPSV